MSTLTTSLFQRRLRELVWVVVALLVFLPMLVFWAVLATQPDVSLGGLVNAQTLAVAGFSMISIGCGVAILLRVTNRFQDAVRCSCDILDVSLDQNERSHATASGEQIGRLDHNELTSLTNYLTRLQEEFTSSLRTAQSQAQYLDNLESVLDQSVDMVVIMDTDSRIVFSNRAARKGLGLVPDTSPDHALAESILSPADGRRLAQVLRSWEDVDTEFTFEREDREEFVAHCIQTVVEAPGNQHNKILILRDMTESNRMKRQLYRSEKLAALGQLISGVAHELNNPLTAILGFAEICRDPEIKKKELLENLEVIEHEASRSAGVVENLLNFSRRRSSRRSSINVRELLERCLTLLSYNFRTGNISVCRHYAGDFPTLQLDEYQIQQVFMNLMINAAQAMREAETERPTVTVSTAFDRAKGVATIEIRDNGPGIPEEVVEQIFSPFFTTKQEDQGTGLGLTVSRNIVEEHGGTISLSSQPGQGAVFSIAFTVEHDSSQTPEGVVEQDGLGTGEGDQEGGVGGRVLVMDDETSILSMTRQALTARGFQVTLERTLAGAQRLLDTIDFDVVIADVHMPDGDGMGILTYIKNSEQNPDCRCVFITGNPRKAADLKHLHGDVPVLVKPFRVQDFVDEVTRQMELQPHRDVVG